jgi:hypothetical protein
VSHIAEGGFVVPEQPERELTPRERIALQALLDGKSYSEASRRAGYSSVTEVADKLAGRADSTPTFRRAFERACEAAGLTPAHMVRTAMANLDARQFALGRAGEVVELGPDAHASAKQWDSLAKTLGMFPDPRLEARLELNAQIVVLPAEYAALGGVSMFGASVIEGSSTASSSLAAPGADDASEPVLAPEPHDS